MIAPYANIHHFDFNLCQGDGWHDVDGEVLFGYYYEICDNDDTRSSGLIGPYNSKAEAETACNKAWDANT